MWPCHIAIRTFQNRSADFEQAFVELICTAAFWKLAPVVESASTSIDLKSHFSKGFSVTLSLEVVVSFRSLPCEFHAGRLQQFHGVQLRRMADTAHSKTRV